MAKTILVTGANGQLGNEIRNIVAHGKESGGTASRYIFTDVNDAADTVRLDVTDDVAVLDMVRSEKVDVIVNCAAYTNVDKAEGNPESADLLNHLAAAWLAEAAYVCGAVMIHISTDYVFSGKSCLPYKELDETAPESVYGTSKLAGERAVVHSGCRHIIFRTAWLYSVYGNNFVKTMRKLTSEKDSINVVFDQIGSPTCAADLAALIVDVIEKDMTDRQGIYHFTDEGVCSWYDFAKAICELSGNHCDIRPCHSDEFPSRVARPHFSVLDKSLVKKTFGVEIPHWHDSLRDCIAKM